MNILMGLTRDLPIGTNLALLQFFWMLVSGSLLAQRGALFPSLKSTGLSDAAVRRARAAFRGGVWQTAILLELWRAQITGMAGWQVRRYGGYRAVAVDTTAFWRPTLQKCPSKHYHPGAQRARPAVVMGIACEVGEIGGRRVACPRTFVRAHPKDPSESRLWADILHDLKKTLADDEIVVVDAGVKVSDLQEAELECCVLRPATNFTARRNYLPAYAGKGRKPVYGLRIRPLERCYKGKTLAKSPPDRVETWVEDGVEMRAEIWDDVVLPDVIPDQQAKTFNVCAIYDPAYTTPVVVGHTSQAQSRHNQGHLPGSLVGGANHTRRQANGRRSSPVCPCRLKYSAFARIGPSGGFDLDFPGSNHSPFAYRILGSQNPKNPWARSPHFDGQAFSAKLPFTRATSQKGFGHRPSTHRYGMPEKQLTSFVVSSQ